MNYIYSNIYHQFVETKYLQRIAKFQINAYSKKIAMDQLFLHFILKDLLNIFIS